ncbi:MAG: S46 family peptidase [Planctomycetota bacterium]|nr:S46 family peptidase [Planctomycetota bacterium]
MHVSRPLLSLIFLTMTMLLATATTSTADEGMWLFNNPPHKILKERHGFEPTDPWLTHLQQSSVRFNVGGSGSFVSSDGLVLTNHHVGADALQKLSSAGQDYVKDGFYAKTREEEVRAVDLELNVLLSIEDVTARINAAVKPALAPAEAAKARQAAMNTVEKESTDKTGLRSDVVTLYQGGLYHLYRFKKYTDVRLVFAPEQQIAFFGGDQDNFEYPRFDLDICLFRVYEEGKPAKIEHFLKWSAAGAGDGELVFVSGHPGHTDRANIVAHLEFLRDRIFPTALNKLRRWEVLLSTYSIRSDENARRAQDELFGIANSRKARLGGLAGLQDPSVMNEKQTQEAALRQAVEADPRLQVVGGRAWDDVGAALTVWHEFQREHDLLERGSAFRSELFVIARTLLRLAEETAKPNADRMREYRESNLESLRQQLFSEAPIYEDLEIVKLTDSLSMFIEWAGADNPLVQKTLAGQSPLERAAALVRGSKLHDVAVRKKLAEGGQAALESSGDPLLELARLVDGPARQVRKAYEDKVEEPLRQAYARITNARFALHGIDIYPDATFTLRLAFGVVRGYTELGQAIPPWTTFAGLYQRSAEHGSKGPFALPPRWLERKDRLDLNVPFNFVSTADIIGGNSGSPVVNRHGEFVGIIFDGNLQSLVWDFVYTDKIGRALAVDSRAITEALRKIYDAGALADELGR